MITKRIIPCLDVNNGRVVKGVNFVNLIDAGDPVEIAAPLTVSPDPIQGRRLENQQYKSGIPRATPPNLTAWLPRLPPILYMHYRSSVLSYSKAPWGLSV